jgi:hypothetical protein
LEAELKDCPFCGAEAEWDITGDGNFSYLCNGFASIRCSVCEASTDPIPTSDGVYTPEEAVRVEREAANAWNKRVDFSQIDGKQLISEDAIAFLSDNHPEIYDNSIQSYSQIRN